MQNAMIQLYSIPSDVFQQCLQHWKVRLEKCVLSQREYFEENLSFYIRIRVVEGLKVSNLILLAQDECFLNIPKGHG